jgi:hypothetical protein
MLPQTFELNLFDTTRVARLTAAVLLGSFALLGISGWVITQVDNKALLLLFLTGIVGGGGYLGWRAYKRAAVVPARLTITPTQLRVEDLRPVPRLSHTLPLADIATYRYSNYNEVQELRLLPVAAPLLKLRSAGMVAPAGDFAGMLAAFEQAIGALPNPANMASRREKSFFEKPISTYLLVLFTLLLAGAGWLIFTSGRALKGNMLGVLGTYLAYLAAWRAAAERRKAV